MNNNIRFLQTGGVPLTNDLMATIQEAYQLFEVLGDVAGHLTILKGCEINGSTIEPGIVAINGEIFPFEGGLTASTVFIHTEEIEKTFEDQTDKVLIDKKTVKFGNAVETYPWQEFVKLETLKEMQEKIANAATSQQITAINERLQLLELKTAPIINGGIIMPFRKPASEIPLGWKECTDFRGKTLVGYDSSDDMYDTLNSNIGSKGRPIEKQHIRRHTTGGYVGINGNGYPDGSGDTTSVGAIHSYPRKTTLAKIGVENPYYFPVTQPSRIVLFIEPNFQ